MALESCAGHGVSTRQRGGRHRHVGAASASGGEGREAGRAGLVRPLGIELARGVLDVPERVRELEPQLAIARRRRSAVAAKPVVLLGAPALEHHLRRGLARLRPPLQHGHRPQPPEHPVRRRALGLGLRGLRAGPPPPPPANPPRRPNADPAIAHPATPPPRRRPQRQDGYRDRHRSALLSRPFAAPVRRSRLEHPRQLVYRVRYQSRRGVLGSYAGRRRA
eukprot:SAG11_NODE_1320_length_5208_cov_5.188687_1_plen_221_part_00